MKRKLQFLMIGLLFSFPVFAADQVVSNNNDSGAGSLRQAIADAGDNDEITFNLASGSETISLSSELSITESLTIDGSNDAGSGLNVTVQVNNPGTSTWRVFNINASGKTIALSNMTIKGGDISANGEDASGYGGGIYISSGTVTIEKITVSSSTAYCGGGIYIDGSTAIITNSTINDNQIYYNEGVAVQVYGGGIYSSGTTTIVNSTITGNTIDIDAGGTESAFAYGAGVCNEGTMHIVNSTISGNSATTAGADTEAEGGGIYAGNVTRLLNSIIVDNELIADSEDGTDISGSATGYYCWCPDAISGSDNNTASYSSDLNAIAYNGGFTNTASVTSGSNTSTKAGSGTYAYYNATDGYYFDNGANYTKISDGSTFTPSDPTSDKILTDQRGYYRIDGTVHEGTTPNSVTSDITRGAYQYYGIVAREGGTWASGGDYYTHIKGAAERETSGTINLAGTAIYEYEIQLDDSETLTIQGEGASSTIVQADKTPGTGSKLVFDIRAGTITIADLTIRNGVNTNTSGIGGGGIFAMSCTINLNRVEITNCRTTNFYGGGFYLGNAVGNITDCTIRGNTSALAGGGGFFYVGTTGTLTITNSTICNNQAQGYGALALQNGTTEIKFSTIVSNIATDGLYTGGINLYGNLTISNTILANNLSNGSGNDFKYQSGTVTDNGYNIVENSNAYTWTGTGDITGEQANLFGTGQATQTLADNGGSTQTMAIGDGSVAVGAGNWDAAITADQRGESRRPLSPSIGSYEFQPTGSISWTGSTSSAWNITTNWSPTVVPLVDENVIIPQVSTKASNPVIGSTETADCANLTIESGGSLTIQSDASGVGSLITSGIITNNGSVEMQRYITESAWHLISIPCTGITANTFLGDYLQSWDETGHDWTDITDPETELSTKVGYALWGTPAKATTYSFTGTPLTGEQNQSITFTEYSGDPNAFEGANLLGNPYPSSIDWDQLNETYGAVYYWDATEGTSGDYVEWNGSGGGSQFIPPMQGFFIVSSSTGSFTVDNASRTHSGASGYYKSSEELSNGLILTASYGQNKDELYVLFDENAAISFELPKDAWKLISASGGVSQLYSACPDGNLSIDVRPETETIQLGFANDQPGVYTIGIKEIADIPEVFLEDTKTGKFHNLQSGDYEFAWNPDLDDENRFKLHFKAVGIEENQISESDILIYAANNQIFIKNAIGVVETHGPRKVGAGCASLQMTVADMMGRVVFRQDISGEGLISVPLNLQTGVYIVTVENGMEVKTEKVFIK